MSQFAHLKRKVPCQLKTPVEGEPRARAQAGRVCGTSKPRAPPRQSSLPGRKQVMLSPAQGHLLQTTWLRNSPGNQITWVFKFLHVGRKKAEWETEETREEKQVVE